MRHSDSPWSLDDALKKLDFFADNNIYWLEEPLHPDNLSEHSHLQKQAKFHIAAGEAYSGIGEFKNFIEIGNTDVVQFDACHSGGFLLVLKFQNLPHPMRKKCNPCVGIFYCTTYKSPSFSYYQ